MRQNSKQRHRIVLKFSEELRDQQSASVLEMEGIMAKNLIIVESPAKSKTIQKFLGKNYEVVASNGHVRDMPKSQMGVDFEHDFEPKYITIRGKGDLLASLRKEVKKADKIFLATDPDREGEAISWHLCHALKLDPKKYIVTLKPRQRDTVCS